jgi:hypothetical protein
VPARALIPALVCAALLVAPTAASHLGVPQSAWLTEAAALRKVRAAVKKRYVPPALKSFKGRCNGLLPRAKPRGRFVYKHFACTARARFDSFDSVTFTFAYRVHVVGKRGRIVIGG